MRSEILSVAPGLYTTELEIQRSRFIAWAGRADTEQQARDLIHKARQTYPDARHHCSAFVFYDSHLGQVARSSDDGEPAGTAGRPMLEVLHGSGLSNLCVVVTRYFGGILLGTGGLVRAYGGATTAVLENIPQVRLLNAQLYSFVSEAATAGKLEAELRAANFAISDVQWGAQVTFTVALESEEPAVLQSFVDKILGTKTRVVFAGSKQIERPLATS